MMILCPRKSLLNAISYIAKFRDIRHEPTLVKVCADKDNGFTLTMLNVGDGIAYRVTLPDATIDPAEESAERITTRWVRLDSLLKLPFHDERVSWFIDNNTAVQLKCGDRHVVISEVTTELAIDFPDTADQFMLDAISGKTLGSMLRFVLPSFEKGEIHPILGAVLYRFTANGISAQIEAITANGFTAHIASQNRPGHANGTPTNVHLSGGILAKLLPLINTAGYVFIHRARAKADDQPNAIYLKIGNHEIMFGETMGKFPNVAELNKPGHLFGVVSKERLATIAADLLAWKSYNNRVDFTGGYMTAAADRGRLMIKTDIRFKHDETDKFTIPPVVNFNVAYLNTAVSKMPIPKGGDITIRVSVPDQPLVLQSFYDNVQYNAIIMPMSTR